MFTDLRSLIPVHQSCVCKPIHTRLTELKTSSAFGEGRWGSCLVHLQEEPLLCGVSNDAQPYSSISYSYITLQMGHPIRQVSDIVRVR